jgi:uncharacterized membrane protein YdjX (TVP38/TMEM64 family)
MAGKLRNICAVVAAALVALMALMMTIHYRFWGDLGQIMFVGHKWVLLLQHQMTESWLAFTIGQMFIAGTGILPASVIAVMAGAIFGLGWGLLISAVGTMLGGWLAFCLSRTALRRFVSRHVHLHPAAARFDNVVGKEGWRIVLLLRVSPIMPFALTSYGLGLSRISQKDYLLGTLASLPSLLGYVALGAAGKQSMIFAAGGAGSWYWLSLASGVLVVFYAMRRLRKAMAQLAQPDCY